MVNICRIRGPDGGGVSAAFFRSLPDRPGTYSDAAAYACPAAYVCASGSAAPDDSANSDAAPDACVTCDTATYACANSDAAAYANSDAAPARRANFGFHSQHSKRPMG